MNPLLSLAPLPCLCQAWEPLSFLSGSSSPTSLLSLFLFLFTLFSIPDFQPPCRCIVYSTTSQLDDVPFSPYGFRIQSLLLAVTRPLKRNTTTLPITHINRRKEAEQTRAFTQYTGKQSVAFGEKGSGPPSLGQKTFTESINTHCLVNSFVGK